MLADEIAIENLIANSEELIDYAQGLANKQINIIQIMTYFSLGKWIVDVQQGGKKRAKYGAHVISKLSERLQKKYEKGFSIDTLKNCRRFYLTYQDRISETVFSLFAIEKSETVFSFFEREKPFKVSWSHYLQLMRIKNEDERSIYETEAANLH
ncbi:MAG: DUF1016 N-terminal domain-containing protein [Clostridiaceae bacterium]|nr:DUF1016 N-terminal domain-containing protein [Clostridiaceae bacterium]